jgi:hypothetical protein
VSPHLDAGLLLDELQELGALGHGGVQDGALLFQALRREKTELKMCCGSKTKKATDKANQL